MNNGSLVRAVVVYGFADSLQRPARLVKTALNRFNARPFRNTAKPQ
jgi:hypothetical protein